MDRPSIEKEIMKHDAGHFKQAHDAIARKDKTHEKLRRDEIRNKVLQGELQRDECDDERMHHFLQLLKIPERRANTQRRRVEITKENGQR